ncbi:glycosyltransferase family 2 protein [bacterium]|nr:glycosyltransferase family 2 protein [bacterium]
MPSQPSLWIIILNWRGAADTIRCLTSAFAQDYPHLSVLVVDNGSGDDSAALIRAAHPDVSLLELPTNLGFAGGMNRGCEYAMERGADLLLLLNNDATLAQDAVSCLVEAMIERPDAGMVTPCIYHQDEPQKPWYAGGRLSRWTGTAKHETTPTDQAVRPVSFATGCCLLLQSALYHRIGGLNERYFLYFEDVEYCTRVLAAGYAIYYVPTAHAWHAVGASTNSQREKAPALDYYDVRNGLFYIFEHLRGLEWLTACLFFWLVRMPRKFVRSLLKSKQPAQNLLAILSGIRDGFRAHGGARPS